MTKKIAANCQPLMSYISGLGFICCGLEIKDKVKLYTKSKIFLVFFYICAMEMIKPKRGRTKVPENQRKRLVSAYLTDDEKNVILAKYGSLTNAVRGELLPKLYLQEFLDELENEKNGHSHPGRD
jgi:hypothetical protein